MAQRRTSGTPVESVAGWTLESLATLACSKSGRSLMLVRDVLESKGRRLIAIDGDATVSEAIAKLVQNNIGSLPVLDQAGQLAGIFSERDVLRLIHNRGEGFGRLRMV